MCNCGCDSSMITIPKGETGATGAIGPTGPQGPPGADGAAASGKIMSEGSILSSSIAGLGYDTLWTCNGSNTPGEWGLMGSVWIETTGSQTIQIKYYFTDALTSTTTQIGSTQSHVTAGSTTLIPLCLPATIGGVVLGDVLKINISCSAGGTILARNSHLTIK